MAAYYNEFDPKAAAWLRELIKQGHIADGVVDDRSIEDVRPDELMGFTQCHFFAGIGVWSYALRRAGWADDRPVWTGSCPCQPFSAAGKGAGFDDERHLWPAFHHLISQCRPPIVLGEQVASKDGLGWLDLVQADLEATGYASGAVDLCAAGIGAPHIRQRLWWVGTRLGNSDNTGPQEHGRLGELYFRQPNGSNQGRQHINASVPIGLADTTILGRGEGRTHDGWLRGGDRTEGQTGRSAVNSDVGSGLADTSSAGCETNTVKPRGNQEGNGAGRQGSKRQSSLSGADNWPSPTNGHWRDADWLFCRDGKWRPVEPGTSPLAHGAAARVGRLRGYGNAIVAQAAQAFIESVMD